MTAENSDARPTGVLRVDDEPLVRALGVDVLEDAGFHVVEAANAHEALQTLESRSDVRVLFTDVNMPGEIDGLALARVVRERRPEVRLLVTSGQARPGPGDLPDTGHFVPKPWDPDAIVGRIRNLIDRAV